MDAARRPEKLNVTMLGDRKEEEEEKEKKKKKKKKGEDSLEEVLDMLKCPVCLSYSSILPVYTCSNGHFICNSCRNGMASTECEECLRACQYCRVGWSHPRCPNDCKNCPGKCPLCRDHKLRENTFAGKIAHNLLKDVLGECQFAVHGCKRKGVLGTVARHEERCPYREEHCPAKHQGVCTWIGSMIKMDKHFMEHQCVQVVRRDNDDEPFMGSIPTSVFDMTQVTWVSLTLNHNVSVHRL